MPISKASSSAVAPGAKGDLVVGNATNDSGILAVGSANQVLTVDSTTATGLKWANNPTPTWTQRLSSFDNGETPYTIAYNGTNLYVAAGTSGRLFTSPDLITWTSRTSGFGANSINKVIFANSLWVAVGNAGLISTSSDGITWNARTANMSTNAINDVTFAAGNFVAVGEGGGTTNTGGITYSTDGTTWTRKSQSLTIGTTYYAVIYNGTNFIVSANLSTNNFLYASTPSGTWTAAIAAGGATALSALYFDGTRTFYWSATTLRYSTSATLATATAYPFSPPAGIGVAQMRRTSYFNNEIHVATDGYYYKFSTIPASGASGYPSTKSTLSLNPMSYAQGVGTPLAFEPPCILATSNGIVMASLFGIYTSF